MLKNDTLKTFKFNDLKCNKSLLWCNSYWLTCLSDRTTVHTPTETCLVTEGRRPVSLTVTVLVVIAHLQYIKRTVNYYMRPSAPLFLTPFTLHTFIMLLKFNRLQMSYVYAKGCRVIQYNIIVNFSMLKKKSQKLEIELPKKEVVNFHLLYSKVTISQI